MGGFKVLDLFCGIGGFSAGFKDNGFDVTGVDISEKKGQVYRKFVSPNFIRADLGKESIQGKYDVIIGGPPCRPWSSINLTKRASKHRDYHLVEKYVAHIKSIRPKIFIMENVPALRNDEVFKSQMANLSDFGYSVSTKVVKYSEYGAATSRRRLVAVGIRDAGAESFLSGLQQFKHNSMDVESVIGGFRNNQKGTPRDHVWPDLKTINKYVKYYESGKYGWAVLDWNKPAPSFGNVMKTYILHPDSNPELPTARVVSVLEVSRIMGLNHGFEFPPNFGVGERYQMLVDSVSPIFSNVLAKQTQQYLKQYRFELS